MTAVPSKRMHYARIAWLISRPSATISPPSTTGRIAIAMSSNSVIPSSRLPRRPTMKATRCGAASVRLTYRFPPWERVSADIKENIQPLSDDFSSFLRADSSVRRAPAGGRRQISARGVFGAARGARRRGAGGGVFARAPRRRRACQGHRRALSGAGRNARRRVDVRALRGDRRSIPISSSISTMWCTRSIAPGSSSSRRP